MNIMQITAIGLVTALLVMIVKQQRPDIAMIISLAAGAILFIMLLGYLKTIASSVEEIAHTGIELSSCTDMKADVYSCLYYSSIGVIFIACQL
jgi:membrane-associated HD superfamily phosphohydrolase